MTLTYSMQLYRLSVAFLQDNLLTRSSCWCRALWCIHLAHSYLENYYRNKTGLLNEEH